jgi:plasmid maintenance system antidote protein VapI
MLKIEPIHPGKILLDDLMKPLGITQKELAKELKTSLKE